MPTRGDYLTFEGAQHACRILMGVWAERGYHQVFAAPVKITAADEQGRPVYAITSNLKAGLPPGVRASDLRRRP